MTTHQMVVAAGGAQVSQDAKSAKFEVDTVYPILENWQLEHTLENGGYPEQHIGKLERLLQFAREGKNLEEVLPLAGILQRDPGSARAMEAIYRLSLSSLAGSAEVLGRCPSLAEARNRYRQTRYWLWQAIQALKADHDCVGVTSVAAGSALALLDVIYQSQHCGIKARAKLVDIAPEPLRDGEARAHELGISNLVKTEQFDVNKRGQWQNLQSPDTQLFEIVGLLDYCGDRTIVGLLRKLREGLPQGGMVLWSNVLYHRYEAPGFIFHPRVFGWKYMQFRTTKQMQKLTRDAGFERFVTDTTPLGLHGLVLASA